MPTKEFDNVQLDVTFIQAATRSNITSGEDIATSFGKISKWFTDLKSIAWNGHPTVTQKDTTSTISPNHEETFTVVDSVTRNGEGHVTGINVKTVKLPTGSGYVHPTHDSHASGLYKITVDELGHVSSATAVTKADITDLGIPGSDTKVTQTNTTTSDNYRVILSGNANDTTETATARKSANFLANPSTGEFYAKGYRRIDITGKTIDINSYNLSSGAPMMMFFIERTDGGASNITNIPVASKPFLLDVELIRWGSSTDYITRQTFTNAANPANSYVRYCTNGTWGAWTTRVYTDTNTKNTAGSTNTSSKIFLIGATSQAANPQTYSHDTAYVGTDGHLYSNGIQVVNLSGSQALTNKTYNGYTLAAACAKGIINNTSVSPIGWVSNTESATVVPTINAIAYWNGASKAGSTSSNLAYCNKGAFGTAATKGVDTTVKSGSSNLITSGGVSTALGSYLPLAGGTMDTDVKIKMPNTDGRIGILAASGYKFKIPSNVGFAMGEAWYTDEDLSNNLGGIGAYGTANDISYFYVGGTYNDPLLKVNKSDGNGTFTGSVTAPSFVGNATSATRLVVGSVTVQTGSTKKAKITLETLMSWLITKGHIPSNTNCYRVINIGWQYSNNDILQLTTTTAAGTTKYELQLAGVTIEFIGSATNYNTGVFRLRIHSSPVNDNFALTSGYNRFPVSHIAEYYCNGSGYSPTWKILSSMGDGEAYNVTQSVTTTSNYRAILMGYNNSTDASTLTTTVTNQAYASSSIYAQPSTGTLYASKYNGYKVGGDPGNWFSSISVIRNDGVMEAGKYIDFHTTNTGTTDYDVRLTAGSGTLTCSGSITATSFSGNASSASKLATARTITLDSGLQGSVSFNGSANVTLNGSLKRCSFVDEASDWATYPWRKIANTAVGGSYADRSITFMVTNSWSTNTCIGILRAHIRVGGKAGVYETGQLKWMFLTDTDGTYIKPENFVMVYTNNSGSTLGVEIWVKNTARYNGYMFTVLDESHRTGFYDGWALTTNPTRAASYTSGTGVITSTVSTLRNTTYTKLLYSGTGSAAITIDGLSSSTWDCFTVVVMDGGNSINTHNIRCNKDKYTRYCVAKTPTYNASSSSTGLITLGVGVTLKTDTIEIAASKYRINATSSGPSSELTNEAFRIVKVYGHKYYYS